MQRNILFSKLAAELTPEERERILEERRRQRERRQGFDSTLAALPASVGAGIGAGMLGSGLIGAGQAVALRRLFDGPDRFRPKEPGFIDPWEGSAVADQYALPDGRTLPEMEQQIHRAAERHGIDDLSILSGWDPEMEERDPEIANNFIGPAFTWDNDGRPMILRDPHNVSTGSLYHELGHAHSGGRVMNSRDAIIATHRARMLGSAAAQPSGFFVGRNLGMGRAPGRFASTVFAAAGLAHAPLLYEEGRANFHAWRMAREDGEQILPTLAASYATYVLASLSELGLPVVIGAVQGAVQRALTPSEEQEDEAEEVVEEATEKTEHLDEVAKAREAARDEDEKRLPKAACVKLAARASLNRVIRAGRRATRGRDDG